MPKYDVGVTYTDGSHGILHNITAESRTQALTIAGRQDNVKRASKALAALESNETPAPTVPRPSFAQIEQWASEGGCEATDGCWVEVDGTCPHGHESWLRHEGLV